MIAGSTLGPEPLFLALLSRIADKAYANLQAYWEAWYALFDDITYIGNFLPYLIPVLGTYFLFRFARWLVFGSDVEVSQNNPHIVFVQEGGEAHSSLALKSGD